MITLLTLLACAPTAPSTAASSARLDATAAVELGREQIGRASCRERV